MIPLLTELKSNKTLKCLYDRPNQSIIYIIIRREDSHNTNQTIRQ